MRAITLTPLFVLRIYFQIVNPLRLVTHIAHATIDTFFFFLESAELTHASAISGELSSGYADLVWLSDVWDSAGYG